MLMYENQQPSHINEIPRYKIIIKKNTESYQADIYCNNDDWNIFSPLLCGTDNISYITDEKKICLNFKKVDQILNILFKYYKAVDSTLQTNDAWQAWDGLIQALREEMKLFLIQYDGVRGLGMNEITHALKFFLQNHSNLVVIDPGYNAKEQLSRIHAEFNSPENKNKIALIPFAICEHNILIVVNPHDQSITLFDPKQTLSIKSIAQVKSALNIESYKESRGRSNYLPQQDEWACGVFVVQIALDYVHEVTLPKPVAYQPELHLRSVYRASVAWSDKIYQDYLLKQKQLEEFKKENRTAALQKRLNGPFAKIAETLLTTHHSDFSKYAMTFLEFIDYVQPNLDQLLDERLDVMQSVRDWPLKTLTDLKAQIEVDIERFEDIEPWINENYKNLITYYFSNDDMHVPSLAMLLRFGRLVLSAKEEQAIAQGRNEQILMLATGNGVDVHAAARRLIENNNRIAGEIREYFPDATDKAINLWHKHYDYFIKLKEYIVKGKVDIENLIQHTETRLQEIFAFIDYSYNSPVWDIPGHDHTELVQLGTLLCIFFFKESIKDRYISNIFLQPLENFDEAKQIELIRFIVSFREIPESEVGSLVNIYLLSDYYQCVLALYELSQSFFMDSEGLFHFVTHPSDSLNYALVQERILKFTDIERIYDLLDCVDLSPESKDKTTREFKLILEFIRLRLQLTQDLALNNPFANLINEQHLLKKLIKCMTSDLYPLFEEILLRTNQELSSQAIAEKLFSLTFSSSSIDNVNPDFKSYLSTRINYTHMLDACFDDLYKIFNLQYALNSNKVEIHAIAVRRCEYLVEKAIHNQLASADPNITDILSSTSFNLLLLMNQLAVAIDRNGFSSITFQIITTVLAFMNKAASRLGLEPSRELTRFMLSREHHSPIERCFAQKFTERFYSHGSFGMFSLKHMRDDSSQQDVEMHKKPKTQP